MHHLRRALISACTAALLLGSAACGDDDTTGAPTSTPTDPAECSADGRTLAVAVETYVADNGSYPTGEQDLVDAGLLRTQFAGLDLVTADGRLTIVATEGGECDGVELTRADTVDAPSAARNCAVDEKVLEVAVETYIANAGVAPATEAELVTEGLLRSEIEGYDLLDGAVVPVEGVCD